MPVLAAQLVQAISIHALREEGDVLDGKMYKDFVRISIHALREEGDGIIISTNPPGLSFLSTPSARRATHQGTAPWPA